MSLSRRTDPRRFVPHVEPLEDRSVPAGNVLAALNGGNLFVGGDAADNQFEISGVAADAVIVRSADGTTLINGRSAVLVRGVTRDIYVRTFGGDDRVVVNRVSNRGTLNIDTGDGSDALAVSGAAHRGATILATGSGDDDVILNGMVLRRYLSVDTGAGDDAVTVNAVGAVRVGLLNPSGTDFLDTRSNSTLALLVSIGFTPGTRPAPVPPPTATVTTTAANPTNAAPLSYTVTFSEDVTGFDASDVVVTNGTVASLAAQSARVYAVQVAPAGQGAVSVSVPAGAAAGAAGGPNTASAVVSVTFDSVPPAVTTNPPGVTTDRTPALTGTVNDPTATVRATVNGKAYLATVAGGGWTVVVTEVLADGAYPVTVTATDPAGNVGTAAPVTLTVDNAGPAVSTFDLAPASDSGTVGDLRTDAATVTLVGTTQANARVQLFATTAGTAPGSGAVLAETTASGTGAFTFANRPLAVGPQSFAVRALDALGNAGTTLTQTFTRNAPPTLVAAIGPQAATAGGADLMFNLTDNFDDAERVARVAVTYPTGQTGNIDVNLFANQAGATVTNFLSYNYDNSVFHRLAPGFVLQGGGFNFIDSGTTTATAFPAIPKSPPVANQPGVSNTRGTIALAKTGGDPNSGTNEFFFNLADNSSNLDVQNGGFTVFGQVMNGGQQVLNAVTGSLTTFSGPGIPGAPPFPVRPGTNTTSFPANVSAGDLALVTSVDELSELGRLVFSATSSNTAVATASVTAGVLTVSPLTAGTTTITVRATDLDGSITETQFVLTVM